MSQQHALRVPAKTSAPGMVRGWVEQIALPAGCEDDLKLLLTELVTNSVRHAGLRTDDVITVRVRVDDRRIRAEVDDEGRGLGSPAAPANGRVGGFGFRIVDQVAERWGRDSTAGTRVWFELGAASR